MRGRKLAKIVIITALVFPFVLMFSFWGYLVFSGDQAAFEKFGALAVGCIVGLALGIMVGYRIRIEEEPLIS